MAGKMRKGANMLAARVAHASVEGSAFIWTKEGFRAFLLLHSLAILWALGPKKTVSIGLQCGIACSAARFAVVLAGSSQKVRLYKAIMNAVLANTMAGDATLESIWDFDPPGDLGSSGAWKVLKELARTMATGVDSHEELQDLDPLPFPELVIRLVLLYKHLQEHPVTDEIPKEEITGKVTPEDVETLCKYLYFADQSYDCGTEENLKEVLDEHGYDLNFAKLESTWAEHYPAYFIAVHPKEKEFLITVRGTAQVEDVITDLTAMPTDFADTDELVHGGIYASAMWLKDRLLCLSQAMAEAGYSIKVVGHSLGAGAAAMLAMWLKQSGVKDVICYAFATPNCVSLDLAEGCQDYVTSVVFRDDIIARFSPAALAKLHKELLDFNVETAVEKAKEENDTVVRILSFVRDKAADSSDDEPQERNPADSEKTEDDPQNASNSDADSDRGKAKKAYKPHIPGRVLYIYRRSNPEDRSEDHELAFVKLTSPALRCIHLSDKVIKDHLIDSYFQGFGRKNPSKIRLQKKKEAEERERTEDKDKANANKKQSRREQSATDRDKEEKDKGRSWKAKLGLVSA